MIKVAVTGNIGSGKTEFIKFISKLGFCCISSDAIISKLYNDDRTRKIILEKLELMIIITKKKLLICYRMKSLIGNLREQYILFYTPKKK